jgi:heme exporter protein D
MNYAGFIFAAWGVVAVVLALYSVRLLVRGRALTKAVEPQHRRWIDSGTDANGKPRSAANRAAGKNP